MEMLYIQATLFWFFVCYFDFVIGLFNSFLKIVGSNAVVNIIICMTCYFRTSPILNAELCFFSPKGFCIVSASLFLLSLGCWLLLDVLGWNAMYTAIKVSSICLLLWLTFSKHIHSTSTEIEISGGSSYKALHPWLSRRSHQHKDGTV